jgi:hypothetical protein
MLCREEKVGFQFEQNRSEHGNAIAPMALIKPVESRLPFCWTWSQDGFSESDDSD